MYKSRAKTLLLLGMLYSFISVVVLSMLYMAKDNNFYNIVFEYFNIPKRLYSYLILNNISKELLVNGMNISSLLFIICNYALSQVDFVPSGQIHRTIRIGLIVFWGIQFLLYNTVLYRFIYEGRMGILPDPVLFRRFYQGFHHITIAGNLFSMVISSVYMVKNALRKEPTREMVLMKWSLTVINIGICVLYFYMYYSLPDALLWISRAMNYTTYTSLTMASYIWYMKLIPYLVILFIVIFWINSYRYERKARELRDETYVFSSIVASSEISTRVFSHYVKNELLGISSEVDWIKKDPADRTEGLERIKNSCFQIYERLDLLQKNSNRIVLNLSLNNIVAILNKVLKELEEVLKQNEIQIDVCTDGKAVNVFCDSHYIREAFRNILLNAVDAMQEMERQRQIHIETTLYNEQIRIDFQDNGPGINPAVLNHLFEPFISTKSTKYNWGIGLSFSKRIIHSHNGKIEAMNCRKGGAIFSIYLPIIEERKVK